MSNWVDWTALGQIILVGLITGVGLVAVFGVAMIGISMYRPEPDGSGQATTRSNPLGIVLAVICIALCAAGVVWGIAAMLQKS